jgi:mannose-6-phosphate isomerase-like protein (cupin superfamily)
VDKAQYFPASQIAATFGVGNLADAPNHRVATARRTGPGESELHDHEMDIFYILAGGATFVTGGTMEGGREVAPGDWRGTGIAGGEIHQLKTGDVITIPAGLAHWFRDVPTHVDYFVVKVIG